MHGDHGGRWEPEPEPEPWLHARKNLKIGVKLPLHCADERRTMDTAADNGRTLGAEMPYTLDLTSETARQHADSIDRRNDRHADRIRELLRQRRESDRDAALEREQRRRDVRSNRRAMLDLIDWAAGYFTPWADQWEITHAR
jgi:hypothetical protein